MSSQSSSSLAMPNRLKRKFGEVDFSSEIIQFHVSYRNDYPKKVYHIYENVFNFTIPNFATVYPKDPGGSPHYTITDMRCKDFENILHWVVFGQIKYDAISHSRPPSNRLANLFEFYQVAEMLKVPGFQNALIGCVIDIYNTHNNAMPWDVVLHFLSKSNTTSTGLPKLCIDMIVYREHDKVGTGYLRQWARSMPEYFFVDLACKMIDKSAIPPYKEDRKQYYVSEA